MDGLFCAGGVPIGRVYKINAITMTKLAESAYYGGDYAYAYITALAVYGDYVYCGGGNYPACRVWKIKISDMSKVAESEGDTEIIRSLTVLGDYVYCGRASEILKIQTSDMSTADQSVSYGGIVYAMCTDGTYIYCAGHKTGAAVVWKIDPADMSVVAQSAIYGSYIYAIACCGNYIYCGGRGSTEDKIWKLQTSDMGKIAESADIGEDIRALACDGDYVYCESGSKVWKIDVSDMSKIAESESYGGIYALNYRNGYLYCGGVSTQEVWKLDVSDMGKIAIVEYLANQIYDLVTTSISDVYDYPLSPIMFPAKVRRSTLKEKCVNFETSMSDVCLVFNHNVRVTREYLQLTYGDITHPESSNLRYVLPSQQLVRLSNKDLTAEDYKAIINNFITNVSGMFTLINENNELVKQWLDDYEPDEKGHNFTDVKMRPIIIGDDLDKTMDELFKGIIDNVTILNMNLEVLKERF